MGPEQELGFLTYAPELAGDFKRINEEWILELFSLEEEDRAILDHPGERIIAPGGQIWFARHPERGILGCCALMPRGNGAFELTKMGVNADARGLKLGERLLQHVLEAASQLPIARLFLLSSTLCAAAVHLYEKNGFVHDEEVMREFGSAYACCTVSMRYPPLWKA